jgi:membrane protein involved in colicin uptake
MSEAPLEGELVNENVPVTQAQLIQSGRALANRHMGALEKGTSIEAVGEILVDLQKVAKDLEKNRKACKEPIIQAGKDIDTIFKVALDPLAKAITNQKGHYSLLQRQAEEARRKAAEAEAKRIQQNAEKRAERQEAKGDDEAAQRAEDIRMAAEAEAAHAEAAIATAVAPPPKGVSGRKVWKYRFTDEAAFKKACLDGTDKRLRPDMVTVNKAAVTKMVKALEDGAGDCKGLEVYCDETVAIRSK